LKDKETLSSGAGASELLSDFPVSTFGKVSKKALVEMVAAKLERERAA
jgi:2,3-dihydroxybenzoate-AMP ligase